MRIKPAAVEQISHALTAFIGNHHAELRLYGSRVHDDLRGGDIDLLLITDSAFMAKQLINNKHYILSAIKHQIGDQNIDLLITDQTAMKDDLFLHRILPSSISLKKWP